MTLTSPDYFQLYMNYVGVNDSEVPALFHRWTSVSIIGALLGRQVSFPFGHGEIYPNQFIMMMGSPGTRKSTAINAGAKLLKQTGYSRFSADRTSKERFLIDMAAYDEDLIAEDLEAITLDEPSESYVVADEFTDFIGQSNMEFVTMLTKLWDCPEIYKHPKIQGKSVEVWKPTVNILSGTNPQGFALSFPPEALGNGFLSRMIFVYGEVTGKKVTFPAPPDKALTESLVRILKEIKAECRGKMAVSKEATELCHEIYRGFIDIDDTRFKSYSTRRFTHILKLATCIACSRQSLEINALDMLKANTLLHYTECKMPKALGEFGKSKYSEVASQILEILNNASKPLTIQALWKQVNRELGKLQELGDIMRNLQHAGKVQIMQVGKDSGYMVINEVKAAWANHLIDDDFLTAEEKE